MKITKSQLKRIIKEEIEAAMLDEGLMGDLWNKFKDTGFARAFGAVSDEHKQAYEQLVSWAEKYRTLAADPESAINEYGIEDIESQWTRGQELYDNLSQEWSRDKGLRPALDEAWSILSKARRDLVASSPYDAAIGGEQGEAHYDTPRSKDPAIQARRAGRKAGAAAGRFGYARDPEHRAELGLEEIVRKVIEEFNANPKLVGSDSNQVRDPAAATSTGEDQMQKLIDAGVDPGDLNACRRDGGDLVKCLWQKNTGYTGAMRAAGLIPAQAGS